MHKHKSVKIVPVDSAFAADFCGILNRVYWREKYEIERVEEVEKKLKEVKFGDYKSPTVFVRRNSDERILGYLKLKPCGWSKHGSFEAYADPGVEFDEECWLAALEFARDFVASEFSKLRVYSTSVEKHDPLFPLYERLAFRNAGSYRKARFIRGEYCDEAEFEFLVESPYPVTAVYISELSGAGGKPPHWKEQSG